MPLRAVVEIFDLAHLNASLGLDIATFNRRRIAWLLSIVTFPGVPLCPTAFRKKRSAASRSRLAFNRKSTVAPALSTVP